MACVGDSWCPSYAPSCNLATHKCVCRIPSAGNLVQNPGFETNLAGWTASTPPMQSYWTSDDADGCHPDPGSGLPGSGSVSGAATDGDPSQCVSLNGGGAGNYYFGAKFKFVNTWNTSFCTVSFYNDASCTLLNTNSLYTQMGPDTTDPYAAPSWRSYYIIEPAPVGAQSAKILCATDNSTTEMDQFFLNKGAANF